ncbi:MAG: MarR family transcriptional regulator [Dermatophilaceae bacterium]
MDSTTQVGQSSPALTHLLGDQLVRIAKLFAAVRHTAPSPHPGVDHTHFPVLGNLADGPKRVSDLALCVHSDVSTVSRQITHLVSQGIVSRTADPHDGRVAVLDLTDEGRAVFGQIVHTRGEWLSTVLQGWSPPEIEHFVADLTRFADALDASRRPSDSADPSG